MRWDVSSLPPRTNIQSAALLLAISDPTTHDFYAYESLRPWIPGQATWNEYQSGQPWTTAAAQDPGTDRGTTPVATLTGSSGAVRTFQLDPALLQQWVDSPSTNHGLVVQNYTATNFIRWWSADSPDVTRRPLLQIVHGTGQGTTLELQQGTAGYNGMVDVTFGAPALSVQLASDSSLGAFSTTPAGPWSPALQVDFAPGSSTSTSFHYRDTTDGGATLTADGGTAWIVVPFPVVFDPLADAGVGTDGGDADAGSDADGTDAGGLPDGGAQSDVALLVGCGCGQGSAAVVPAFVSLFLLISTRRTRR